MDYYSQKEIDSIEKIIKRVTALDAEDNLPGHDEEEFKRFLSAWKEMDQKRRPKEASTASSASIGDKGSGSHRLNSKDGISGVSNRLQAVSLSPNTRLPGPPPVGLGRGKRRSHWRCVIFLGFFCVPKACSKAAKVHDWTRHLPVSGPFVPSALEAKYKK